MPLLAVKNLKKSFVTRTLFENISFEVEPGEHIGFVGANGTGKTTLFRILLGEEQYDEGSISFSRAAQLGSMRQAAACDDISLYDYVLEVFTELLQAEAELNQINLSLESSISSDLLDRQHRLNERYAQLGGATFRARTRSALTGLGFSLDELGKPMRTFSGGQRNKAQLAKLLLSQANFLLLDEPTNHLDIKATEWLEGFLGGYSGAFIVISHDRYFLDKVTSKTMELKDGRLYTSRGNFSRHMELRSSSRELERRNYLRTVKEIKRIEGIIEQQKRWNQAHNYVTAASKQKQADKLRATLVEPERDSAAIRFKFRAKETGGNDVLAAKGLSKAFNGKTVFENVDMLVKKGERVFILGDNGCGKTTLLNILAGKLRPTGGAFYLGAHIYPAYYEQTAVIEDPERSVLNEVWDKYYAVMSHKNICNALASFLFRGDDVNKPMGMLSGGELARVQLLKLMLTQANLLFLDEPTNHLDIASREALESALEDYDGTMLIVTHDRYLVNRMADRVLCLSANGVDEYIGGYDDYLDAVRRNSEAEASQQKRASSANADEYRERKALQSMINKARGELARIEAAISGAEAELDDINAALSLPHIASDYKKSIELSEKSLAVKSRVDALYAKWEAAGETLDELLLKQQAMDVTN